MKLRSSRPTGREAKARRSEPAAPKNDAGKLGAALQEGALERLTGTIAELERCQEPTLAEATHEIRRHGKKLRALLRLVRSCLGRRAWKAEDAELRAMGRAFGKLRDAHIAVRALDALRKRYFEARRPALLKQARRILKVKIDRRAKRLTQADTIAGTTAALQAARTRCLGWDCAGFGWKEALLALGQSYKRIRKAASAAAAEVSVKRLHDWRKFTKELGEQVRLLRKLHPRSMDELADELDVLAEFLGDDHDLSLLRDELEAHREVLQPAAELDALLEVLDLRRGELIRTAIDLGERLFDLPAKEFTRSLRERHQEHRHARKQANKLASTIVGRSGLPDETKWN